LHHLALLLVVGFAGGDSTKDPTPVAESIPFPGCITNAEPSPSAKAESNQFAGRITNVDGSPITLSGVEFAAPTPKY